MERKLPIEQVSVGMFVVELDRPWLDTPFLLQGFLVRDERTLAQLRTFCQHVVVDAARSTVPVALEHLTAPREEPRRVLQATPAMLRGEDARKATHQRGRWLQQIMEAAASVEPEPSPAVQKAPSAAPPKSPGKHSTGMFDWMRGLLKPTQRKEDADASDEAVSPAPIRGPEPAPPPRHVGLEEGLAPAAEGFARANEVFTGVIQQIRTGKGLELERVESVVEDLVDSILRNPEALQLVARLRESDEAAYGHALQVAVLMVSFGREIGFAREELSHLGQIGMLLDIGKLRVSPALLHKPGNLTPEEFVEVKRHVDWGMELIRASGNVHPKILDGIHQHHERLDGSGYPRGLKDKQIGAFGRMAGIVDCFSAMTSPRPYADAMSPYEAMRQLQTWGETFFNAGLVQQFIQAIGIFPVGTLVELSTAESAVVIEQHKAHRLKPKVLIVADSDGAALKVPIILDLLYGTPPKSGSLPYIRRGLAADSAAVDSSEYYLARA
jgi:HD-GYP domain-containing protein (c-di-GMP phosphodiesterase class II)